jgi:N-acetylglucosaminyldiphosphoundecaprenol N-acetyl-beta-D-mannosaminyltransferase
VTTNRTRVKVLDVIVDAVSMDALTDEILEWTDSGSSHVAIGINAHVCNLVARDPHLRALVANSDLNYADGQSIVWAAKALGVTIPERVATTDLVVPVVARAATEGKNVFFFGGAPGVAAEAAARLRKRNPGLKIESHHGHIDDADRPALIRSINAHRTDILFVGLGDPAQQEWVRDHRDDVSARAILTCGGLFDWLSGSNRRAPKWMIRAGLEWLWRMIIEPRRLARRYLVGNPIFIAAVVRQRFSALSVPRRS